MPAERRSAAVVVADRLTRVFGDRVAVRDLSLAVNGGEIVALLGPNGAGKTTTLRMLAGLIQPTAGQVSICNIDVSAGTAAAARSRVGLLTETPGLWERLSVRRNLLTYAHLHGLADAAAKVDHVLRRLDLADRARDLAGSLSKGLKQRVAIARALVHEPPVLLLDEPTSGLDPAAARSMRDLIVALSSEGRSILVSTHNLAEAEQLAHRVAVLRTSLLAFDTPAALRHFAGPTRVVIEFEGDPQPEVVPIAALTDVPDIVNHRVAAGKRIVRVAPEHQSLEEIYLGLVGDAHE